jgi:hypothetical protein
MCPSCSAAHSSHEEVLRHVRVHLVAPDLDRMDFSDGLVALRLSITVRERLYQAWASRRRRRCVEPEAGRREGQEGGQCGSGGCGSGGIGDGPGRGGRRGAAQQELHMEVLTKATLQTVQVIRHTTSILHMVYLIHPNHDVVKALKAAGSNYDQAVKAAGKGRGLGPPHPHEAMSVFEAFAKIEQLREEAKTFWKAVVEACNGEVGFDLNDRHVPDDQSAGHLRGEGAGEPAHENDRGVRSAING